MVHMRQQYDPEIILLSWGISYLGAYLSITCCEQYRLGRLNLAPSRYINTWGYLALMAFCFGGVGIWCTHFVGMSALTLHNSEGVVKERYNVLHSIFSLVVALTFVGLGTYVCSLDRVFTMTRKELIEDFVAGAKNLTIKQVQHVSASRMLYIIGTNELHYLALGGGITGSGIVVMHYIGMAGIEFEGHMKWNAGVIAASVLIAFAAATAAFWILFRVLSIFPNNEALRQAASFVMALAVNGMHYVGMLAASFVEGDQNPADDNLIHISSQTQFNIGVGFTIVVVALAVMINLADLRHSVQRLVFELSRADDTMLGLSLPPKSSAWQQVRKYVKQRKFGQLNTNVITSYEEFGVGYQYNHSDVNHTDIRGFAEEPSVHYYTQFLLTPPSPSSSSIHSSPSMHMHSSRPPSMHKVCPCPSKDDTLLTSHCSATSASSSKAAFETNEWNV